MLSINGQKKNSSLKQMQARMASPTDDFNIWVVAFDGQGHLFPCLQLCHRFAAQNSTATLLVPANLSSSVPRSLRHHPKFRLAELPPSPPPNPHGPHHSPSTDDLEELLSSSATPHCAVVDVMMNWTVPVFQKFGVLTVAFFTSGACSSAMQYAIGKASPLDLKPGETRLLPGLPKDMGLTDSDLKRRPPGGIGRPLQGPPPRPESPNDPLPDAPGAHRKGPPPGIEDVEDSAGLMFNTSDDLERPFLEYIAGRTGKLIWGVGPLLPEQFWKSTYSLLSDREFRSDRPSNVTEDEVIDWLDSKPRGSVLYVAFGSEVGPTVEEYPELAAALESSNRQFIWVIQSGRHDSPLEKPENHQTIIDSGFEERIGSRGLIIKGWAPQLLILSHPSTAAFLSHCGWNSTTEAIARGVPILAWPIRGDQYWNAKLVASHLKVGFVVTDDLSQKTIRKDEIVKGIEKVMGDEEIRERASKIGAELRHGFPESSTACLDCFYGFMGSGEASAGRSRAT